MIENNIVDNIKADVLIITAVKDELDAVLNVKDETENKWHEFRDSSGFLFYYREFLRKDNSSFGVAVAQASGMGETRTANLVTRLIIDLSPFCLAMCGICAGFENEVNLGDVIVADRVFKYDYGKLVTTENIDGQREEEFFHDMQTYNLNARWKQSAEYTSKETCLKLSEGKPITIDFQMNWVLNEFYNYSLKKESHPLENPDRKKYCPDWKVVITKLREQGYINLKKLEITKLGKNNIKEFLDLHPDGIVYDSEIKVKVGPLATGSSVMEDSEIFKKLKKVSRKNLGLDMEAFAIGYVAEVEDIEYAIIVKAVTDFAHKKGDSFREFAAKVSAEFLIDFLKNNLPDRDEKKNFLEDLPEIKMLN